MLNKYISRLEPIINRLKPYSLLIFITLVGCVYGYIITTSGKLASVEPSEIKIQESYKVTKSPSLDEVIANKLEELEDRNVNFQAIIDEARKNPFAE